MPSRVLRRLPRSCSGGLALSSTASFPLRAGLLAAAGLLGVGAANAADAVSAPWWQPEGAFVQFGKSYRTNAYTGGLLWHLPGHFQLFSGTVSFYAEAAFGRWAPHHGDPALSWNTQVGVTPVVRWQSAGPWFAELGIGANHISPHYHQSDKYFSSQFNFGDHVGVGLAFGERRENELALRIEHFSNAGISLPNPGIEFAQLRYSRWF